MKSRNWKWKLGTLKNNKEQNNMRAEYDSYGFYYGFEIKKLLNDENFTCDSDVASIKIDEPKLYGVHLTKIREYGIFWPDEYKIDYIEDIPDYIFEKIEKVKQLNNELEWFKENKKIMKES